MAQILRSSHQGSSLPLARDLRRGWHGVRRGGAGAFEGGGRGCFKPPAPRAAPLADIRLDPPPAALNAGESGSGAPARKRVVAARARPNICHTFGRSMPGIGFKADTQDSSRCHIFSSSCVSRTVDWAFSPHSEQ